MKAHEQARRILEGIDSELRDDFEKILSQSISPNTKGYEYEKAVSRYLSNHLGRAFEFHTRARIVDRGIIALKELKPSENEFDVVGAFSNSCPRIICTTGDTPLIPYDTTAIIIEVKQDLTKSALKRDMRKMIAISRFEYSGPLTRATGPYIGKYATRPIRVLFYYRLLSDAKSTLRFLNENSQYWDMVMIYSNDMLLTNSGFPLSVFIDETMGGGTHGKNDETFFRAALKFSLVFFLFTLSHSIPESIAFNTSDIFLSLLAPLDRTKGKLKKQKVRGQQRH